jgi:hypothetical protein
MPLILASNSASGGYNVANSLRFNSGSSDNLTRTLGTATSRRIFTISTWIKRSNLDTVQNVFTAGTGSGDAGIRFNSGNELFFYEISSPYSAYNFEFATSQLFRDVSAWYHIVVAVDTTQATNTNRVKIYVNGSQVTAFATGNYPSQNYDGFINNSVSHKISGAVDTTFGSRFYNGYVSETYFIDGTQLTPSSFGETDTLTGIWKPKAYTGSYGTNGFYLQFKNSASLGTDSSGNGNTFTVNNLTSVDQSTDTPTNNFSTWNAISAPYSASTLTEGNLVVTNNSANWQGAFGTIAVSKSKWYWEAKCTDATYSFNHGVFDVDANSFGIVNPMNVSTGYTGFYNTGGGQMRKDNATSGSYGTFANGDIMGIALDMDNKLMSIYKNGTIHVSNFAISTGCLNVVPCMVTYQTGAWQYNFGSPMYSANSYTDGAGYGNFSYSVPSGYYSLNTKNLATFG